MQKSSGFSVVELVVVVAIIGTLAGIAIPITNRMMTKMRADGATTAAATTIQSARNRAIAERRNVRFTFTAPNRITVTRIEVPGPATTVVEELILEQGLTFLFVAGAVDTPDGFAPAAPPLAIQFTGTQPVMFTSDGSLIDDNGDVSNGTVFLGVPNQRETGRAITIFGATGFMRTWQWGGTQWIR